MNLLKLLLILVLIMIGLASRHHAKPHHAVPARTELAKASGPRIPVNQEILQNAERLTETLRRCQQTAQKNKQTQ